MDQRRTTFMLTILLGSELISLTQGAICQNEADPIIQYNLKQAAALTKIHKFASFGCTKFSNLTDKEFAARYLGVFSPAEQIPVMKSPSTLPTDVPPTFDWRTRGVITAVKNQKSCGGCWAFSSVETVESMAALGAEAELRALSVQQTIDCAEGALGCGGGDVCLATNWMYQRNVTLVSEDEYPLTDTEEMCHITTTPNGVHVHNTSCYSFVGNEQLLISWLNQIGPVSASVDASLWKNYQGGVIMHHCGGHINHAVQIVGYNLKAEVPYYIVRNSWGTDFGIDGYLHIAYGDNVCGIASRIATVFV